MLFKIVGKFFVAARVADRPDALLQFCLRVFRFQSLFRVLVAGFPGETFNIVSLKLSSPYVD